MEAAAATVDPWFVLAMITLFLLTLILIEWSLLK
jgi:hypothetical protein